MSRLKYNYEMLKNICDEGSVILLVDYKDKYITRDTRIIGKCILCENSFNKSLNKLHKQRNFGCEICAKILKFERIKNTMVDKYGIEYAAKLEHFRDKMKSTTLERYGVEHNSQREEIQNKIKKTNLEKYGVERCMQNPEIMEKSLKMSYYLKEYTLPSGNIIKIQGYEHFALNELFKNINENDIITGCKNVPTIWYNDESGKKHRHFVDIFIPSQNKCIEVKSTWTFKKQKEIVLLKKMAGKNLGYLYEIWVYDKIGNKVEFYD
jgi:hypothetical protein